MTAVLAGSGTLGARSRGARRRASEGLAIPMVIAAIAILGIFLYDMQETASTSYAVAAARRDELQAEYLAKSSLNLTRLLVADEPKIGQIVAPLYQMLMGRPPPQLPVWRFAGELLSPFCTYSSVESEGAAGIAFDRAEGLGELPGSCSVVAVAENSKINVNDPLTRHGDEARRSLAMQFFGMMGGYHAPSPFDPLFENRDAEGNFTSRLDIVSAVIDWWDTDTQRTLFDPGAAAVSSSGGEDDIYQSFDDPYRVKNAPLDTIEELRLVRGFSDDFWATFVEPTADDPISRGVTIYGSGSVNPNEAPPEVILARLCSFVSDQSLCGDPLEAAKFIQLVSTVRMIAPVPFFSRSEDFTRFVQGQGGEKDLYPMLVAMLGPENPLLFRPITIPENLRVDIENAFVTAARILTIESTGTVGRATVRLRSVVNFHDLWTPPPPNAGRMPTLGVFHYYRVN